MWWENLHNTGRQRELNGKVSTNQCHSTLGFSGNPRPDVMKEHVFIGRRLCKPIGIGVKKFPENVILKCSRCWFNQPIETSLFLGCAGHHALPGLCSLGAGENRDHLKTELVRKSFFMKISPLIFKNSKDTICFSHLKFSLNELIISPQNPKLLPLISSLISKAIWMLGLGEECLEVVMLLLALK